MSLRDFPIFADENIFKGIVDFLREEGFDVKSVNEEGLMGKKDIDLMQIAFEEGRVIVTQDSDFGNLVFTQKADFIGVIYLRPGHYPALEHIQSFKAILAEDLDINSPFIITANNKDGEIRIRVRNFN